jgi:hypothetical protein
MIKPPKGSAREVAPAGSHDAVCFRIADLGTQTGQYGAKRQIHISWELSDETNSHGKPFVVGKFYNLVSNSRGTLKQDIESWFGRTIDEDDFCEMDLANALQGRTCTLGIVHEVAADGKPRETITSIMLPRKGIPIHKQTQSDPVAFSLESPLDRDSYNALPEFLRNIIARSPEYQDLTRGGDGTGSVGGGPDGGGSGSGRGGGVLQGDKGLQKRVQERLNPRRKAYHPKPSAEDTAAIADDAIPF